MISHILNKFIFLNTWYYFRSNLILWEKWHVAMHNNFPPYFSLCCQHRLVFPAAFSCGLCSKQKKHQLKNSVFPHCCILIKMELTGQQFIHAQTRAESHKLAFRNPRINWYSLGTLPQRAEAKEFHLGEGESWRVAEVQRNPAAFLSPLHNAN